MCKINGSSLEGILVSGVHNKSAGFVPQGDISGYFTFDGTDGPLFQVEITRYVTALPFLTLKNFDQYLIKIVFFSGTIGRCFLLLVEVARFFGCRSLAKVALLRLHTHRP